MRDGGMQGPSAVESSGSGGPTPRVLIVEDDYFAAKDTAQALRAAGYRVVGPVPDTENALRILAEGGVDAALLDIRLGEGNSFGLAKALKRQGVPVAFLSGLAKRALPPDLADLPVFDKPADLQAVAGIVAAILRRDTPAQAIM
ncbi:response regulator [Aureimonas endophytica]|uniref:Response regulator n=1 Tax=Aureimonas endophytica TaxID=2027858 RepID=A0A917E769_9HYPH|nr:response regulator [Aureimonas endophytica]GGE10178.1 response regulator [Aureimonas endophytica]